MDATTTTTRPKKRRQPSGSPDENSGDDGKKRGRPRVDKQDESAADRRRTQIRMAQRAYRQRKEGTLEELRKRVSELTNTMELMNKTFMDCRDRLSASGLPEAHLQDLHEVAVQYDNLMKIARNPDEEQDPEIASRIHRDFPACAPNIEAGKKPAEPKNVPSWMDEAVLAQPPKEVSPAEVGMGYTMYMPRSDGSSSTVDYFNEFDQRSQPIIPGSKPPHPNSFQTFRVELPDSMFMPPSMDPPRTYSFQETTFARRLHRACLEQGYQLLLDPQRRPASYDRVFGLSLMSRDRAKLTAAIKSALAKGAYENLDQDSALLHVGGAGTHFPRRDEFGNLQPKKQSWNLGIVGPQTLALLENAARDSLTADMTVHIAGFEGEWLDAHDVEGYLNEKGIFIDPSSSFAEAEVAIHPSTPSEASTLSTSSTAPTTPDDLPSGGRDAAKAFDTEQLAILNRSVSTPDTWNGFTMMNSPRTGFSNPVNDYMNFLPPSETTKLQAPVVVDPMLTSRSIWEDAEFLHNIPNEAPLGLARKKVVIIDVAKFIKVLTVSGVCLGRGPGFRRRDVDRALALASFDAF